MFVGHQKLAVVPVYFEVRRESKSFGMQIFEP